MKLRWDKDILKFIRIALGVILLGVAIFMVRQQARARLCLGGGLIIGGMIMLVMAFYAATKSKTEIGADERIMRINEKAGYNAGWLIMLAVTLLFWADKIWSLNVELKDMYYTTIFVGIYSWLILRWYYGRKGDKE